MQKLKIDKIYQPVIIPNKRKQDTFFSIHDCS